MRSLPLLQGIDEFLLKSFFHLQKFHFIVQLLVKLRLLLNVNGDVFLWSMF